MHHTLRAIAVLIVCLIANACSVSGVEPHDESRSDASAASIRSTESVRPNIVLFLFDDAGYSDLSSFGGEIDTPTITRLAKGGTTIARFYTAARCSPTRAGILTGRYPHSVGMADLAHGRKFETAFRAYKGYLPREVPLLSELLQAAGYRTMLQGKWHLGRAPTTGEDQNSLVAPNRRGFDEFVGLLGAQAPPMLENANSSRPYQHNGKPLTISKDWYSVEGLNRISLSHLNTLFTEEPGTPFFLYIASQAPHLPVDAPDALIKKYEHRYAQPLESLWNQRVEGLKEAGLLSADAFLPVANFSPKERKNVLAQALGSGHRYLNPHIGVIEYKPGDKFLLCSDGVTDGLWDRALSDHLTAEEQGSETRAATIVRRAVEESGRDNATAVVVET